MQRMEGRRIQVCFLQCKSELYCEAPHTNLFEVGETISTEL